MTLFFGSYFEKIEVSDRFDQNVDLGGCRGGGHHRGRGQNGSFARWPSRPANPGPNNPNYHQNWDNPRGHHDQWNNGQNNDYLRYGFERPHSRKGGFIR